MIKFIRKDSDEEGTEGKLSESRGWCEAVVGCRILMASESVGRTLYAIGLHAGAALEARDFFESDEWRFCAI